MGLKQNSGAPFFVGLVTGGLVGAGLSLLLAPQTGEEIRVKLKNKGLELKDRAKERAVEVSQQAQEQMTVWQEKGKEVFEKGKHSAFEAMNCYDMNCCKEEVVTAINSNKNDVVEKIAN